MGLIKGPISIAKFGVKAVANTAFYGLALYGAINVAINTFSVINYIKSLQNPKQEIVQTAQDTIDRKIRETTAEAIMGESLDERINKRVEQTVSKYIQTGQLIKDMKKHEDYIEYRSR